MDSWKIQTEDKISFFAKNGLNAAYLAWFLNSDIARAIIEPLTGHGVSIPVVRREVLENLEIPIPSEDVQRIIGELASLNVQQQRLLSELAEAKQTLMTTTLTRWFTSIQTNKILQP